MGHYSLILFNDNLMLSLNSSWICSYIRSQLLDILSVHSLQYVYTCCGFYFQIYPNCFGYIYLWRDFMHYFWIVFPAILPISMIIRGVLAFRCRLNKELYGTTNKNGFEKVSEFTLPTELHNKKNIEISKLLCGYWLLVVGLILFVCWMIFAYVYVFNVQATSNLPIVSDYVFKNLHSEYLLDF